jgi:hypothetical protein
MTRCMSASAIVGLLVVATFGRGGDERDASAVVIDRIEADARHAAVRAGGYSHEVSLAAAIEDFNREHERWIDGGRLARLEESEVVAALLCWNRGEWNRRSIQSLKDEQYDDRIYDAFRRIATTRVMPKGSRFELVGSCTRCLSGPNVVSSVILLRIGLDRFPADLADVPCYSRQIRRTYSLSGPVKLPIPCSEEPRK